MRNLVENFSTTLVENRSKAEDHLQRAADAYRAALQVAKLPSALFGLSMERTRSKLEVIDVLGTEIWIRQ